MMPICLCAKGRGAEKFELETRYKAPCGLMLVDWFELLEIAATYGGKSLSIDPQPRSDPVEPGPGGLAEGDEVHQGAQGPSNECWQFPEHLAFHSGIHP